MRKLGSELGYDVRVTSVDHLRPCPRYGGGDVCDARISDAILKDVTDGRYDVIHAGTPCNTWTAAKYNKPTKWSYPLRPTYAPFSYDWCRMHEDVQTLQEHNYMFTFTMDALKAGARSKAKTVYGLENPEPWEQYPINVQDERGGGDAYSVRSQRIHLRPMHVRTWAHQAYTSTQQR